MSSNLAAQLKEAGFKGEIWSSEEKLVLYSTDASFYRIKPLLVVFPTDKEDLKTLMFFAYRNSIPVIPRGTGTSLAGQVVGKAIVADISKNFKKIIEINKEEKYAVVQPGVIRDELNLELKKYGLIFGPETSTSNRATIGGMFGNNSSGSRSLRFGTTRQSIISAKVILSNGDEAEFSPIDEEEFNHKLKLNTLEGKIYRTFHELLSDESFRQQIDQEFPDKTIHRRNTGYPLDELAGSKIYDKNSDKEFNIAKFLSGTEGTLAFAYEIKVKLFDLPPDYKLLIASQFGEFYDVFDANVEILKFKPYAIELIDDKILKLTEANINQNKNRFFIKGNPKAVLLTEIAADTKEKALYEANRIIDHLNQKNLGYYHTVIEKDDINKVWDLRKAGLGVLSNMRGDAKPVGFIEDTAVSPYRLKEYIADIDKMLKDKGLECVYYAHIGSGELHLRPVLNIKDKNDVELMHEVALETAKIVKKHKGSLSGEHGDGLLRSEFIPIIYGERIFNAFRRIKQAWDPKNIMNPGKITEPVKMTGNLRYSEYNPSKIQTVFKYTATGSLLQTAEKCNGSADCRKNIVSGGVMCPTYMATGDENFTTRARANTIREYLTSGPLTNEKLKKIIAILSFCLSCKSCKSECPSGVDITKMKADLYQIYYDRFHAPLRNLLIANIAKFQALGSKMPGLYNFVVSHKPFSSLLKSLLKFAPERELPKISSPTWYKWYNANKNKLINNNNGKKVLLFVDEFTNYLDAKIGIAATELLTKLGYNVSLSKPLTSGRTYLSKGFVKKAKAIAINNIKYLDKFVSDGYLVVGIEPSAILTLRDEYLDLTDGEMHYKAQKLAEKTLTIDEFLFNEIKNSTITSGQFDEKELNIILHTHCYQKVLSDPKYTEAILNLPIGTKVKTIKSGCCGMAGSFGYEKEHYDLSIKIGNLSVVPEIKKAGEATIIAAPGTSCREQIKHGTQRNAKHPVEILNELCKKNDLGQGNYQTKY